MASKKLNALKVKSLTEPGMYNDGDGLYLQVRGPTQRSWIYRYKINRQTHLMGLGSVADVSLAEARDAAEEARKLARRGVDPIADREARRIAAEAAEGQHTFEEVANLYIAAHSASWKNEKHRAQWPSTLLTYAYPVIGKTPVAAVTVTDVMKILDPIWNTVPETASRLRGRLETVLDYASARGWRSGENPARWRGHLASLLPAKGKVKRIKHHAALPWGEVVCFLKDLEKQTGTAALALKFTILTAARTGEVIGAKWAEIDLEAKIWTVPAERMKAHREHRVALSDAAIAILRDMAEAGTDPHTHVFSGRRYGTGLSNMAMLILLRRMSREDITTHGFRSAFRDWAAEATDYPAEVAEMALAHTVGNKVEAAYRRGDLLDKRRAIMDDWAKHCGY